MITLDNLDQICTYHTWSPEQVERGKAIRVAAKEAMRAALLCAQRVEEFKAAIESSDPHIGASSDLQDYAKSRRADALSVFKDSEQAAQEACTKINEIVMVANSAITFEATNPVPLDPPDSQESTD